MAVDTTKMAQDFARDGAFASIRNYVKSGEISAEDAADYTSQMFSLYRRKIAEAQKELHHLHAVLHRMEAIATAGARRRPYSPNDPQVRALATEIVALDGWVMSLYESDLSMIWWGAPERGRAKAGEMAQSMNELFAKRVEEMKFNLRDTSLFRLA